MKITDIEPYSGYGDPIYHRYLEYVGTNDSNKSRKSDKYWEVAIFKRDTHCICGCQGKDPWHQQSYLIVRRWGKYGAKGQLKEETAIGKYGAKKHASGLKAKKKAKGYTKEIDIVTRLGLQIGEDQPAELDNGDAA